MSHARRSSTRSRSTRSFHLTRGLVLAATLSLTGASAHAAYFADQVVDYIPGADLPIDFGSSLPYNLSGSALGSPDGITGENGGFDSVLSPFSPPFERDEIVAIGEGGQLTLRLQHPVGAGPGPELGIFTNVGLADANFPSGVVTDPAFAFGVDAVNVAVSANGVDFFNLFDGNPLLFEMPTNFFNNAGPFDTVAPANPDFADFGLPNPIANFNFFDGVSNAQIVAELAGSAGGTWLDIETSGLGQVQFVRFSIPVDGNPDNFLNFDLDAVSINSAQALPIPEPASLALLCVIALSAMTRRNRGA